MRDIIRWARSLRFHRVEGRWVYADYGGWLPGSARTRIGALIAALRSRRGG